MSAPLTPRPVVLVAALTRSLERRLDDVFSRLGYAVVNLSPEPHGRPDTADVVCAEVTGPRSPGLSLLERWARQHPSAIRIAVGDGRGASEFARLAEAGVVDLVMNENHSDAEIFAFLASSTVAARASATRLADGPDGTAT